MQSIFGDYGWQVLSIALLVALVVSLLYMDKVKALFRSDGIVKPNIKRDWLTTGRLNLRVPPDAINNPNACFPFILTVQETQTIEDVSGTLHTVPRFRDLTLNEGRQIMKWYNEMLAEHAERLAPADPAQHTHAMIWGVPDHQKKRMEDEAKKRPLIVSRLNNPEPKLPEGMKLIPDQTT